MKSTFSLDWKKWIHSVSLDKYVPRERTPDRHCPRGPHPVPDTQGSAVYVEQMHGSWQGWWLRLQCAVSVLWVSEVSDSTSFHPCAVVFNVLVMLYLCLVHLLKTIHYSKYHRLHLCMFFLAKSLYKEVGNHTVLSPVCLWFTKTKQNHNI